MTEWVRQMAADLPPYDRLYERGGVFLKIRQQRLLSGGGMELSAALAGADGLALLPLTVLAVQTHSLAAAPADFGAWLDRAFVLTALAAGQAYDVRRSLAALAFRQGGSSQTTESIKGGQDVPSI